MEDVIKNEDDTETTDAPAEEQKPAEEGTGDQSTGGTQ